jgi:23S rRNA (uracil1939-C5)-methyltransferase|tara:strand:- start:263 stop:1585 length:1323 start_codon:yes stop_codon:yes gene_type:complete
MAGRKRRNRLPEPTTVVIESMSHEGRGIAHVEGKTVFVFGALIGEEVKIQIRKSHRTYDEAITLEVIQAAESRIEPKCAAFKVCGGCSLQHMSSDDQVAFKQQSLIDTMQHAGVTIGNVMPALRSNPWGYRKKARLGVKFVRKKERLLVGFRERSAPFLADMAQCEVLIPEVGHHLDDLCALIDGLDAKETIPQIEVAADGDHIALVFRHLDDLTEHDRAALTLFAKNTGFWLQLQSAGPDSVVNLYPENQTLSFAPMKDDDIKIGFSPVDFIQVNTEINQQMVAQALHHLDLKPTDHVLDLFCGLGNFTLPMARRCGQVTGVEGDEAMVGRARQSATDNKIENTEYFATDLTQPDEDASWMRAKFDKILIDPPRSGAMEIAEIIKRFKAQKIVYVSCQPSSLVRDSKIICSHGYKLEHLGIMDMFPQTAHVESMAVFSK